jgi:HPt (histidine-containing phosphotransfer) domain-containing protein
MTAPGPEIKMEKNCDLKYLNEMMKGNKKLIREIVDAFLEQVPGEIRSLNDAIMKADFDVIKKFAHTMRSSVTIMGISALTPLLQEIESLASSKTDLPKIMEMNSKVAVICNSAIEELIIARVEYN